MSSPSEDAPKSPKTVREVNVRIAELKRRREEIDRTIECLGYKRMCLAVPKEFERRILRTTFRRLAVEDRAHCWRVLEFASVQGNSERYEKTLDSATGEPLGNDERRRLVFECEAFKHDTCYYESHMDEAEKAVIYELGAIGDTSWRLCDRCVASESAIVKLLKPWPFGRKEVAKATYTIDIRIFSEQFREQLDKENMALHAMEKEGRKTVKRMKELGGEVTFNHGSWFGYAHVSGFASVEKRDAAIAWLDETAHDHSGERGDPATKDIQLYESE